MSGKRLALQLLELLVPALLAWAREYLDKKQ